MTLRSRAVVLDCDGVILDSNAMKTNAFAEVLRAFGEPSERVEAFVDYQRGQFGRSRYALFGDYFDRFAGRAAGEREVETMLASFGDACRSGYAVAPLTEGAELFFERAAGYDLFVCSGSDQTELRDAFEAKELSGRFAAILGSPTTKKENLRAIARRSNVIAFLGDALADYEAARACDVPFVFVSRYASQPAPLLALSREEGFAVYDTLGAVAEAWSARDDCLPTNR